MKTSLTLLIVVALGAPLAGAQSLGEAAAKERERRKHTQSGKVYTDADVRTVAPSSNAAGEAGATAEGDRPAADDQTAGAAGATTAEKGPDEVRAGAETAWRAEIDKLNTEIAKLDAKITDLEAQANDTRGYVYSNRRTVAIENLEKARADRTAAQQKLDDLLDSGRRQGFRAP